MTTAPHADPMTRREAAGAAGGLFERHGRMVYGVCRAMLRDVHEAEDATQQVFLSGYQALLGGARVREPGAWLATIARNECRARIADGMRRPLPVADEDLDGQPAERDEHARRSQVDALRAALAELPERQREAVVLRYLYGLRYGEVATALGLSRPATEALLFRARRSMRLRLRPVVGAALVVPSVVRDALALALPGFGDGGYGGAGAAGLVGSLLVKVTAGPLGLKAATAVVAVSTVGLVGAVPTERVDRADGPETVALDDLEDEAGAGARSRELGRDTRHLVGSAETTSFESNGSTHEDGGDEGGRRATGGDSERGHDGDGDADGASQTTSSRPAGTDDDGRGDAVAASEPTPAATDEGPETVDGGSSGESEGSDSSGGTELESSSGSDGGGSESGESGSGSSGGGETAGRGSSSSGSSGSVDEEPRD